LATRIILILSARYTRFMPTRGGLQRHPFLLAFPTRSARPFPDSRGVYVCVCVINGKRDVSIYALAVITLFSLDTMKLHRSLLAKIAIFIAMFSFALVLALFYYRILLSARYNPDNCNFLFTNLRSAFGSKLFSRPRRLLTYLSLDFDLLAPRVIATSFLA
jgi:hypothetical protein